MTNKTLSLDADCIQAGCIIKSSVSNFKIINLFKFNSVFICKQRVKENRIRTTQKKHLNGGGSQRDDDYYY